MLLQDLVGTEDDFTAEDIRLVLDWIDDYSVAGFKIDVIDCFGIDVIDWEVVGIGDNRQVGILFDMKDNRYGYYTDWCQTVLTELDKTYQELSDWGSKWDCCPEVLRES
jgi:hypothetical protein